METKRKGKIALILIFIVIYIASVTLYTMVKAEPEGATLNYLSNSTKNATSPANHTGDKGYIHVVELTADQQNTKWKAYVGNVSGTLVLRDADEYSIYEWPSGGAPDGEVYITMNSSIDWPSIRCANDTSIGIYQGVLGHSAGASDNINNTFSSTYHEAFDVGFVPINVSTCPSTATWANNSAQTLQQSTENSTVFQEILLMDQDFKLVFTALIDQDTSSYKDDSATENATYDFQAILPDYDGASIATYYFYVEITG